MSDTIDLNSEKKKLERLKQHINAVLNLKPIERLSPLSVIILKTTKAFTDSIGAWAGSNGHLDGLDLVVLDLLDAMKVNCTAEETEVIEIATEGFAWSYENDYFPFSVCPFLMGDEVFWAWEFLFMSDEQIRSGDESDDKKRFGRRRVVLKRFADLGIDIFEHGEESKYKMNEDKPVKETENPLTVFFSFVGHGQALIWAKNDAEAFEKVKKTFDWFSDELKGDEKDRDIYRRAEATDITLDFVEEGK